MVGVGDLQLDCTLHALVNDALMAIFFFAVGLEVRRGFAIGELTSWSRAMVPVAAAIAGLVVPCPCRKPRPHRSGDMLVLVERCVRKIVCEAVIRQAGAVAPAGKDDR